MAGANSAYAQQQAFNKQLYTPGGQGAGLQNDFKNQLSEGAAGIAGARGRRARNQQVQGFHELIWNNPNIPNELKQMLADYAQYTPRPSGSGAALKQTMGGDVMPAPRPGSKRARQNPPAPKPKKKNKMKATVAVDTEPASPEPTVSTEPAQVSSGRKRRMKYQMEE